MNMTSEYAETGIRTRVKGLGSPCDNHYTIPAANAGIANGYKRNLVVQYNGQNALGKIVIIFIMKAMILEKQNKIENNPLKYEDYEGPELKHGQVIVKVQANGVCHSDLHIIEGDFPLPPELFPLIPGHEIVGEVVESKSDIQIGERVGIGWFYSACGKCEYCISGKENLCPYATVTGINHKGGYSEYVALDSTYVSRIPDNLNSVETAPLFCAGITAYSAVRRLNIAPNDRIAVFGIGGLGFYGLQLIRLMGGKACAITTSHKAVAEKAEAAEITDRPSGHYDGAIVFAPNSKIVQTAASSVKSGKTIVVPAVMDKIEIPFSSFMWEKNITSVASGLRKETRAILDIASSEGLISMVHKSKLSSANEVLNNLKQGKVKGREVLVP